MRKKINMISPISFIESANNNKPYNQTNKHWFHVRGKKLLRAIADLLGLPEGSYNISSSTGGRAVPGEVVLHSNNLYISFNASNILYRSCRGRNDYTGGINNYMSYEELKDLDNVILKLKGVMK